VKNTPKAMMTASRRKTITAFLFLIPVSPYRAEVRNAFLSAVVNLDDGHRQHAGQFEQSSLGFIDHR
jgi:hypothetical protein